MMRSILTSAAMILAVTGGAVAEGDPDQGEKVFRKCKACHAVGEDAKARVGPVLNNIMGMQAGTHESFEGKYSQSMVEAGEDGMVWDRETLGAYLEKPRDVVDGTKMTFPGLKKEEDRADVISYLMQFSPDFEPSE